MNNNDSSKEFQREIDLIEVLSTMWKFKWFLVVFAVVGILAAFIKVSYFTKDTYTTSGVLFVSNKNEASLTTVQVSDINAARIAGTTYVEILKFTSFLEEVSQALGGEYTAKQLNGMISVSSVNDTELMRVTVTAPTAEGAYKVATVFLDKAPDRLKSIYKSGDVELADPARMPLAANDKKLISNLFIGALFGIVLCAVLIFIYKFFDTKVRRGEDAAKRYQIPLLGEIALQ